MSEESPLIIALDFPNAKSTYTFLDRIQDQTCKLKVGLQLFISEGPGFVEKLAHNGHQVFLDLKLHDIPNTVASACMSASNLGVWMTTLHASGGSEMLLAAHEAMSATSSKTKLVAVTMLTSLDHQQLHSMGVKYSSEDYVLQLVKIAIENKLDGIVCSAHEVSAVRDQWGKIPTIVTPGIRLADDNTNDQSRIADPQRAHLMGANYIVVGRPITLSEDPIFTINQYLANWNSSSS